MALRNPIAKGSTQILATALLGPLPHRWRLSHKVDHPLDGEPIHYFMLTGNTSLPAIVHGYLMNHHSWTPFIWVDRQMTEYTLDLQSSESPDPHILFQALQRYLERELDQTSPNRS